MRDVVQWLSANVRLLNRKIQVLEAELHQNAKTGSQNFDRSWKDVYTSAHSEILAAICDLESTIIKDGEYAHKECAEFAE